MDAHLESQISNQIPKDIRLVLTNRRLVVQKSPDMRKSFKTLHNETVDVHADGCMIISLYNMLALEGLDDTEFDDFTTQLVFNCCNKKGEIDWQAFNNMNGSHRFRWMQDNESRCERVSVANLAEWISSGNPALVKVQSVYAPWRRHFMVGLEVKEGIVYCLESSDRSGTLKIREINGKDILGIRYFVKASTNNQESLPSGASHQSPFIGIR